MSSRSHSLQPSLEVEDILRRRVSTTGPVRQPSQNSIAPAQALGMDIQDTETGIGGVPIEMLEAEAKSEILMLTMQKKALEDLFSKIDKENNNDIELEEFTDGLQELNIELSNDDIEALFNYIDMDQGGSIQAEEFINFFLRQWNSIELRRLQSIVLSKIRSEHNHKKSNLIQQPAAVEEFDPFELDEETRAMQAAMTNLVQQETTIISKEQTLMEELKTHEEKDANFRIEENANKWNIWEMASKLRVEGLEEYTLPFLQFGIDGPVFLYDISDQTLLGELGIKKVHLGKLHRIADQLRQKCRKGWDEEVVEVARYMAPDHERATKIIDQLKKEIEQHKQKMQQREKDFDLEVSELKKELELANEAVESAKRDGYLESDKDASDADPELPDLDMIKSDETEQMIQSVGQQLGLTLPPTEEDTEVNDNIPNGLISPNQVLDKKMDDEETPQDARFTERRDTDPDASLVRGRSETTIVSEETGDGENPPTMHRSQTSRMSQESRHSKQGSVIIRGVVHHRKKSTLSNRNKPPPIGTKAWWKYLTKKSEENEKFSHESNAPEWTPEEVAFWLRRVGFDSYAPQFIQENVNGEVLFNDLNTDVMMQDLKVKALHCGKLLRHIDLLKKKSGTGLDTSLCIEISIIPPPEESIKHKYNALQATLEEKQKTFEETQKQLQEENVTLKGEVEKLEKQIVELEKNPSALKPDGENLDELNKPEATPDPQELERKKWPKEIQKLMSDLVQKAERDSEFGKANKAKSWQYQEVCYWLNSIEFPQYIPNFAKHKIDGEIIMRDMNATILHEDLEVRRFHTGKIVREIQKLKQLCGDEWLIAPFLEFAFIPEISAKTRIEQLQEHVLKLEAEKTEIEQKMQELINRPKMEENEMIVKKEDYENMTKELARLAEQVDRLEEELSQAKSKTISEEEVKSKAHNDEKYISDLEEKKKDPSFGVDRNVKQWSEDEVCYWLNNIGFGEYIAAFREKNIFGDILVTDMDNDTLSRELSVKRIHINSILREIQELKKRAFGYLEESGYVCEISYTPGQENREPRAVDRFATYEKNIQELKQQLVEIGAQLEHVGKEHGSTSEQKTNLEKELAEIQVKLQTTEETLRTRQLEIEQLKEQSTKALAEQAQEKIQELNHKLEEANQAFTKEKQEITEAHENTKKEMQSQLDSINNTNNELKTNIENKEKECQALSARLEELEEVKRQKDEVETQETSYLESLKQKAENDPLFANPKKANKWTLEEVSLWLFRIRAKEYIDAFKKHRVDGSVLLNDLKSEELTTDIGVQPYHVGKIIREIQKLKENSEAILNISDFVDVSFIDDSLGLNPQEIKQIKVDLETQQAINEALRAEISHLEREMKETPGGPGQIDDSNGESQYGERDRGTMVMRRPSVDDEMKRERGAGHTKNMSAAAQIKKLEEEIRSVEISKVNLAIALSEQIEYLRLCVRVLVKEYEYISGTPFGLNGDPVTAVLNYFGLERQMRSSASNEGRQQQRRRG